MQTIKIFFSLAVVAVFFSACGPSLSPFTQQLYEQNNWTNTDLQRIQFYLSDDLVLYRNFDGGQSTIIEGEIRMVNGQKREEVRFRRGTPGVFLFSPKANRFAVTFETVGEDKYLMFGPNPNWSNRYVLLASNWERNVGEVTYAGQRWFVNSNDAYTSLLVDLERLSDYEVNGRVAGGRRVGGN